HRTTACDALYLLLLLFFFSTATAPPCLHTLSLHDALPIYRKNPVFARPRLVSSSTRSRFIGHSSCGLLYKFRGRVLPGSFRVDRDRKSTRLNSSHVSISYAVYCLKKKITTQHDIPDPAASG